jgi:hypothetical protein
VKVERVSMPHDHAGEYQYRGDEKRDLDATADGDMKR